MSRISNQIFSDPDQLAAALRAGDGKYKVIGRGVFRADLTLVELDHLTLQCASESLPRLAYHGTRPNKVGILGWFGSGPLPVIRGTQMRPGELMSHGRGMESYHRTPGSIDYMALAIDADELNGTALDLTGRELHITSGRVLRPSGRAHAQLLSLAASARRVARATPDVFRLPETCLALKQSLMHAMITCLTDETPRREPLRHSRRAQIMARFEEIVEANAARPLHLAELCGLVGVPERTLRKVCHQHLGMGPHQYLFRRRIHLTRRALLRADPNAATVTDIAIRNGFWDLGRFAVRYRSIFGEVPSDTLSRSA